MYYQEAIDYLYSRLPVFHRIGPKAFKPGLQNIERLSAALQNPHTQFRSIHVAGTNGKGSTSHMLASIYQAAGYRVGLYTSPHLKSFTERIRINGEPIAEQAVADFVEANKALIDAVEPSFFEVTVAMAFAYFARERVDLAIIEVGLGGRLDSTNIIDPILSVITNIGYDHTDILGDTLAEIASEKAGIIKPKTPVVIGELIPETAPVFTEKSTQLFAPLFHAATRFHALDLGVKNGLRQLQIQDTETNEQSAYELDLLGAYQVKNVPAVLQAISLLQEAFPVGAEALTKGLRSVVTATGLKGRFQILQQKPLVIADTAHNKPGLQELFKAVKQVNSGQLHIVFGMVADKDPNLVLTILPSEARYYFCQAATPRSFPAADLQSAAASIGLYGQVFTDVNNALVYVLSNTNVNDVIVVTGSNYIVSELNNL